METKTTIVAEESNIRLDSYLARKLPQFSRGYFQNLIENGLVTVNQKSSRNKHKIQQGETIEIKIPESNTLSLKGEPIPLNIIYEDADIVVINKQCGLVVHPACGHKTGTLVNALVYRYPEFGKEYDSLRPGLVHRLDKGTSGVMVVAKNEPARFFLVRQFAKRNIHKTYLALVYGEITEDKGEISAPIGRNPQDRRKMTISSCYGRDSYTEYKVLKRFADFTYLEVKPETGRTHQIRVHLLNIRHPVCGDTEYAHPGYLQLCQFPRMMLHAWKLKLLHPTTKEWIEYTAPIPKDFLRIIEKLGKDSVK